jgi:hypothetical protein
LGEGLTATVVTDHTGSLKVPGKLTMVMCQNLKTLKVQAIYIKFS